VRIDKAARRWRCASLPPPVIAVSRAAGAALRHARTHGDQPDAAVRAKCGLLPPSRRVTVFRTCRNGMIGIHHHAALGTVANGRVTAPMVEIRTGRGHGPVHSDSSCVQARSKGGTTLTSRLIGIAYPDMRPEAVSKCTVAAADCQTALSDGAAA
jgi:hypothetical protein